MHLRKLPSPGTEDPIVARVSYQWFEVLNWFELSEKRRGAATERLMFRIQPCLLELRESGEKLKEQLEAASVTAPDGSGLAALRDASEAYLKLSHRAFTEIAPILGVLLGRDAPERNYAALMKWSAKWFGAEDRLTLVLKAANEGLIRRVADTAVAIAKGQKIELTVQGSEVRWGIDGVAFGLALKDITAVAEQMVPFLELLMVAAFQHMPAKMPFTLSEIPEAERNPKAPIRYRVMMDGPGGKLVPAGKITQSGNVVPELQRLLQQGRGRPIVAQKFNGEWYVASGSKLHHSPKWKTFQDFLFSYIQDVLGPDWANPQFKLPREKRHPLLQWHEDVGHYLKAHSGRGGGAPMTALPAAYLGVAYSLYLISHNNGKVHDLLLHRLRHKDQFFGAYFETIVAGFMIRAGFDIELEDETDSNRSHCEFTATHRASGQKLSVEAKMRVSTAQPPDLTRQLHKALQKRALHSRLVFIEVNDEVSSPDAAGQEKLLLAVLADLRSRESELTVDRQPAPPAYLVVMNNPPATVARPHAPGFMVEGFKMPDFRVEGIHSSFREALEARERHAAMCALCDDLKDFSKIPVTFDGDTVAFAGRAPKNRLLIGNRYSMPGPGGETVVGELVQGFVIPERKSAWCILTNEGKNLVVEMPLTDAELKAYEESPRTFFGREERDKQITDPLKLYDWIYDGYRHNTKEHLLKLLTRMRCDDVAKLASRTQEELARIYAERQAEVIARSTGLVRPVSVTGRGFSPPAPST